MCWYSHNWSSSIVSEYIVSDPEGNFFVVKRVDYIRTSEDSSFFFGVIGSVLVGFFVCVVYVLQTFFFLFFSDEVRYIIMIWSDHCISHSKYGIYTGSIDRDFSYPPICLSGIFPPKGERRVRCIFYYYFHLKFASFTLSYPVSLHILDSFWPVELVYIIE